MTGGCCRRTGFLFTWTGLSDLSSAPWPHALFGQPGLRSGTLESVVPLRDSGSLCSPPIETRSPLLCVCWVTRDLCSDLLSLGYDDSLPEPLLGKREPGASCSRCSEKGLCGTQQQAEACALVRGFLCSSHIERGLRSHVRSTPSRTWSLPPLTCSLRPYLQRCVLSVSP